MEKGLLFSNRCIIMIIVDGNGLIFGRIATLIAKKALEGEEVYVINAENLVITGDEKVFLAKFRARRTAQHKGTPEFSPHFSKVPHLLVKRMLRGMLPKKSARGTTALKKIMVYSGNPKGLKTNVDVTEAMFDGKVKHTKISRLCAMLGYSG